jgi:hypothetical protein
MPYINPNRRSLFDPEIEELITQMRDADSVKGDVNYAVTRLVLGVLRPRGGWSYSTLSEAIGVLRDSEVEIRRRLLDPYENDVIRKNGDVPEIRCESFCYVPPGF